MFQEEDFLLLSGLQHFAFCRRQWALIHIEQIWKENLRTVEGEILHEKAHDEYFTEKRSDVIISRGMRVFSFTLGITGACDVVEFHEDADGISINGRLGTWSVVPVEYKRGKPKEHEADELQLCAQAMCLEEMLVCNISHGYLYYGELRRREEVILSAKLRDQVKTFLTEMHMLYQKGYTPKTKPGKFCKSCSLEELCIPKLCRNISALDYVKKHVMEHVEGIDR
jgi:CRISPR-associated exonuclease Cas4